MAFQLPINKSKHDGIVTVALLQPVIESKVVCITAGLYESGSDAKLFRKMWR